MPPAHLYSATVCAGHQLSLDWALPARQPPAQKLQALASVYCGRTRRCQRSRQPCISTAVDRHKTVTLTLTYVFPVRATIPV